LAVDERRGRVAARRRRSEKRRRGELTRRKSGSRLSPRRNARSLPDALVLVPSGAGRACLGRRERRSAITSVPAVVVGDAGAVPRACPAGPWGERYYRLAVRLGVIAHARGQRRTCHLRPGHKVVLREAVEMVSRDSCQATAASSSSRPELTLSQSSSTPAKAGRAGSISLC
jgi:hypothetical protein